MTDGLDERAHTGREAMTGRLDESAGVDGPPGSGSHPAAGPPDGGPRADSEQPSATDVRLVPAGLAAWAAGGLAPLVAPRAGWTTVALLTLVGLGAAALAMRARRGALTRRASDQDCEPVGLPTPGSASPTAVPAAPTPAPAERGGAPTRTEDWSWGTAAAAVLAAAVLGVALLGQARATGSVVDELAAERAVVTVDLRITGDARLARPQAGGPIWAPLRVVSATVIAISGRHHDARASAPVVVLATDTAWDSLTPSTLVRVTGRLAPNDRISREVAVLRVSSAPDLITGPSPVQRGAERLRAGLRASVADLSPDARGLLPGLVVGDESLMPPDLVEDAQKTGLTHLTAVSGANVAIVLGVVLVAARWCGARAWAVPAVGVLGLAGFVVLARPEPSVLRASVMGLVVVLGLASGARRRRLSALSAAVVVLLLVDPWLARSYGFALSVLASGAIVLLVPGWAERWSGRLPPPLAAALAVPVAAQLVCAPVVVMLSEEVSLVAIAANLLAAPAVAPATVLGVVVAMIAPVAPPLAELVARVAGLPAGWIGWVGRWFADRPYAAVDWPGDAGGALALAAATVVVVVLAPVLVRRPRFLVAVVVAPAVVLLGVRTVAPAWPPDGWDVIACDVGQGDALVLSVAPGSAVVVDTGFEPDAVDTCLRGLGIRHVPLLLLTHAHADHVGGLLGVLAGRRVATIGIGMPGSLGAPTPELSSAIARAGAQVGLLVAGWSATVGAVRLDVVWPPADPDALARLDGSESAENNASLVVRVQHADGLSVLLTGDVEPSAQRALLRSGVVVAADVLKVPHHGSRHQDADFLRAVDASVALVSVGADNDYGHPSAVTLEVLAGAGARVFRTDLGGAVAVGGGPDRLRVVTSGGSTGAADAPSADSVGDVRLGRANNSSMGSDVDRSPGGAVAAAVVLPWNAGARWQPRAPPAA